jgi:hypothetical protein
VKPIVSPDSSVVIGADAEGRLWKYPLDDPAPPVALNGALPGDEPLLWSPDDRSIWVLDRPQVNSQGWAPPTPARIVRIDPATARRTVWYEVPLSDPATTYVGTLRVVMSVDRRTLAYGYEKHFSDLYLAEGLK